MRTKEVAHVSHGEVERSLKARVEWMTSLRKRTRICISGANYCETMTLTLETPTSNQTYEEKRVLCRPSEEQRWLRKARVRKCRGASTAYWRP